VLSLPPCRSFSAEVDKFEHKVNNAREAYEAQNAKVKTDITSAKRAFDAMVEMELVTMLVSQVGGEGGCVCVCFQHLSCSVLLCAALFCSVLLFCPALRDQRCRTQGRGKALFHRIVCTVTQLNSTQLCLLLCCVV
jgi:hypothetical protein